MAELSADQLLQLINHVFLLPQLPQAEETTNEAHFAEIALSALKAPRSHEWLPPKSIRNAIFFLESFLDLHQGPDLNIIEQKLQHTLLDLGHGQTIAVKVSAQNAAILVTRTNQDLIFEGFELWPENKAIFSTKGRLLRSFPSIAINIERSLLEKSDFAHAISNTLSTMSSQKAPGIQAKTKKTGADHDEDRDSTPPVLISELMFGFLRANGRSSHENTISVSKKTREEVLCDDARRPWRRSSTWLLVRVALHLIILRSSDGDHTVFKKAMILILESILLKTLSTSESPSDLLFCMTAKLTRRRLKILSLGPSQLFFTTAIGSTIKKATDLIYDRWSIIRSRNVPKLGLGGLESLDFDADAKMTLPRLDEWIQLISSRLVLRQSADFTPSTRVVNYRDAALPILPASIMNDCYGIANLFQFEQWVAKNVESWASSQDADTGCQQLYDLLRQYYFDAIRVYNGNPEALSFMVLTSLEIWVAIDGLAVEKCPTLAEYDPEIPISALQNLLLPFLDQMQRLRKLETAMLARHGSLPSAEMFSTEGAATFGSRYFDRSAKHQALMTQIISDAETERKAKRQELQTKKSEYNRLNTLWASSNCIWETRVTDSSCNPPRTEQYHASDCVRCSYQQQRDALSIEVHEWPLPEDAVKAKTVVFELQVPTWYARWRDSRFFIMHTLLQGQRLSVDLRSRYWLMSNDPHLTSRALLTSSRISLMSEDKPHYRTHYREQNLSTCSEATILVRNGLNYQYFDDKCEAWVGPFKFGTEVPLSCTYTLPTRSENMQQYLCRYATEPHGSSPNFAIAKQDDCPAHLSLEEYRELSILPFGCYLQWPNIAAQLVAPGLDLKKSETLLMIQQCIYQAGPSLESTDVLRITHHVLQDVRLALSIVRELNTALERCRENWESLNALHSFVAIATRVMSLSAAAKEVCLEFLDVARGVALLWIDTLREKAHKATEIVDRTEFVSKSVEIALICALTFDADLEDMLAILQSDENVFILIWASIVIQEGERTLHKDDSNVSRLLMRFKRLLSRSYRLLVARQSGVDAAIRKAWVSYSPGDMVWTPVSSKADHWITKTIRSPASSVIHLHFDLLSGELLANGLPLDQPPRDYRDKALYQTLFDKAIVEVMPATSTRFQFSTKRAFHGCQVQLGLQGDHLIVQTTSEAGVYEVVPNAVFENHLPYHFVNDYIYWYSAEKNVLELRPLTDPWTSRPAQGWKLSPSGSTNHWSLAQNDVYLLGLPSPTAQLMSQIFQSLAGPDRVHCMSKPLDSVLVISLPTLQLEFSLAAHTSEMQSTEYRSMIVDHDQKLDTLIGFSSRLILKDPIRQSRLILILNSELVYNRSGDHVAVRALKGPKAKVFACEIDDTLKQLKANEDITCKLYLAYVHALTSFCIPDPFTLHTGSEQALDILRTKAIESFEQLSQPQIEILTKIAELSPARRYYPKHLQEMQTIVWDKNLSFLSQHNDFSVIVSRLFLLSEKAKLYYPDVVLHFPTDKAIEESLRHRDTIRTSTFRTSGYGAEQHDTAFDTQYPSRDLEISSARARNVSIISEMVSRASSAPHGLSPGSDRLWKRLSQCPSISGVNTSISAKHLRYDGKLLESGFDLAMKLFPALHRWLGWSENKQGHNYSIAIWLSTLAFADEANMDVVQVLAICCKSSPSTQVTIPDCDNFEPLQGTTCDDFVLGQILNQHLKPLHMCPEARLDYQAFESFKQLKRRRKASWERAGRAAIETAKGLLESQWRCRTPSAPYHEQTFTYIEMTQSMTDISSQFCTWYDNGLLQEYLSNLEQGVEAVSPVPVEFAHLSPLSPESRPSLPGFVAAKNLFELTSPSLRKFANDIELGLPQVFDLQEATPRPLLAKLIMLLQSSSGPSAYEKQYIKDLKESLDALTTKNNESSRIRAITTEHLAALTNHLVRCQSRVETIYDKIQQQMASGSPSKVASEAQLWPRVSPTFLLKRLSREFWPSLPRSWRVCVIVYGKALTAMHRAERMLNWAKSEQMDQLINEIRNVGHENWDPLEYPEFLLIEVESRITIRRTQAEIAREMRAPSNGGNAVMQLNMGEGKSSVIIPMEVVTLATGSQLVRVIVAKPQSKQMAQMLISKLGSLVNRRVCYMPFSRSLRLERATADQIADMIRECMMTGGVLLLQPEHILSFKLATLEYKIKGNENVGSSLMSIQDFFDQKSRDLVDESDENFSPRFELIYTMGTQRPVELSPERWLILQQVLELVRSCAIALEKDVPSSVEVKHGPKGSFPKFRILRKDAEELMKEYIAREICEDKIDAVNVTRYLPELRAAIFTFVTKSDLTAEEIDAVDHDPMVMRDSYDRLLLLNGLLARGLLSFAFGQKRWRVNYGLTFGRSPPTKLAVPYRAKDTPTPRSEFSHPDVVIVLTSLSYYYGGLSDEDLFIAFEHLSENGQKEVEYQEWVKDSDGLSAASRLLQGVNLKDRPQCTKELFPCLRYGKKVIDYFLSHIVFPKYMKEFPDKLSASGWDIGQLRELPTTGFSGTIDSRFLLPLDTEYLDLPDQKHTNALVLEYLLKPENEVCLMPSVGASSAAEHLLWAVMKLDPPVQVILDVGAQVLELTNLEIAREWLRLHKDSKEAAVFVNDDDEICVVDRQDRINLLRISTYKSRLDVCLVFLDEAHTRGIDLQLPVHYRAAVTLGMRLTKDRLVQACMRMRKLGKGQTVVFCISQEIQEKILAKSQSDDGTIKVLNVLAWSISETHHEIYRSIPTWAAQGKRFIEQRSLWKAAKSSAGQTSLSRDAALEFQEQEAQSIRDRYDPRGSHPLFSAADRQTPDFDGVISRYEQFDAPRIASSALEEEQERELSPETEQERQVQRPAPAEPLQHTLHPDVTKFALKGKIVLNSGGYYPAFQSLGDTTAGRSYVIEQLCSDKRLLATVDFAGTVEGGGPKFVQDEYLRSVQWLLASHVNDSEGRSCIEHLMIISPFEANEIYPLMANNSSPKGTLCIYRPRLNPAYRRLDTLDLHPVPLRDPMPHVPRSLAAQLNVFAGQLYIADYADYIEICNTLGLLPHEVTHEMRGQGWEVDTNGFILADDQGQHGGSSKLTRSPVPFIKALMGYRRNGESIAKTHMGALLEGRVLREGEFEP